MKHQAFVLVRFKPQLHPFEGAFNLDDVGPMADKDVAFHTVSVPLNLGADQFVGATLQASIFESLTVPLVGGVSGNGNPHRPMASDGIGLSLTGNKTLRRRPALLRVKAFEELSITDHARGAVELNRRDTFTVKNPLLLNLTSNRVGASSAINYEHSFHLLHHYFLSEGFRIQLGETNNETP
jgi:hypothetical protein